MSIYHSPSPATPFPCSVSVVAFLPASSRLRVQPEEDRWRYFQGRKINELTNVKRRVDERGAEDVIVWTKRQGVVKMSEGFDDDKKFIASIYGVLVRHIVTVEEELVVATPAAGEPPSWWW